jgi:hypothetical protein
MNPAELVETCERELAEFVAFEQAAIEAQAKALAAFKAEPTTQNRKAGIAAKTDAEFATLAREGGEERLAEARQAKAKAEHEAAVADVSVAFEATSPDAYRASVAEHVAEIESRRAQKLELDAQIAELENHINQTASHLSSQRQHALAQAAELGLRDLRHVVYDVNGTAHEVVWASPAELAQAAAEQKAQSQQAFMNRLGYKGDASRDVSPAS